MRKISLGFLVFNENNNLEKTIKKANYELKKITNNFDIWVFDNNSTDGSKETVKKLKRSIKCLKHSINKKNMGYAHNFSEAISKMKANYLFIIDGDGQYDISDLKMAVKILKKNYDILFGIRKPRRDPFIRILMSFFLNILSKLIIKSNLEDINCGFRGFNNSISKKIKIKYKYNFVNPEVYVISKLNNFRIAEMKVKHYHRVSGISYFNGISKVFYSCLKMIRYLVQLKKKLKT